MIGFLADQSNKRNMVYVMERGYNLKDVWFQTPELCMAAVTQNGYALLYVKNQTPEICREAIRNQPAAIHFVKEQTVELCKFAMQQDSAVYYFLCEPFKQLFSPFTFETTNTISIPPNTIDPITFLPPEPGERYAFYIKNGSLYPIASYDTIRTFIDTHYKGSDLFSVYSPFHNIIILANDVKWFYLR